MAVHLGIIEQTAPLFRSIGANIAEELRYFSGTTLDPDAQSMYINTIPQQPLWFKFEGYWST